ncbi:MAG: T9SS type A sorting domain-containing protein [Chitinophagales bacterium]
MMRVSLLFLMLVLGCAYAQTAKYPIVNLPVKNYKPLAGNAWAGGFNAPEFSAIDLNDDGTKDLFVFDRAGEKCLTFLNDGSHSDSAFHYAPAYEQLFPPLKVWAVVADYNYDGIGDLFTAQTGDVVAGQQVPPGIKVYKGSRINGNLHFDVLQYVLYYKDPTPANLWTNGLGVPAIIDVNHDGDLDVLTFDLFGTDIEYYENQTVELSLPADSMLFNLTSGCWGNVYVGTSGLNVTLNVSCKSNGGNINDGARHGGATLWPLDAERDGDWDVLISESHSDYMSLLTNGGDSNSAHVSSIDTFWPGCNASVHLPYFPAAFRLDGDNDVEEDLLIAPNFGGQALDADNVLHYRYSSGSCKYTLYSDSFLTNSMLDLGTDSKAVFFDYDGDGLMDILCGNYQRYNPIVAAASQVALFRNTGSATAPAFELLTDDFAGLSAYHTNAGSLALSPAFGDLDGDGKKDMVVGDANGDLHYFKNNGTGLTAFAVMTEPYFDSLHVNGFASPFIYDLNNDGLNDLVVGRKDGKFSYYENYGTAGAPQFIRDSVNSFFGEIDVRMGLSADGYSYPFISDDSSGNIYLYAGSEQGVVVKYLVDTTKLKSGAFALLDSNVLNYDAGGRVTMHMADLNGDGKAEYLLGNARGGMQLFSETVWDSSVILNNRNIELSGGGMRLFPNPANDQVNIALADEDFRDKPIIQIFSMNGQRVDMSFSVTNNSVLLYTNKAPNGVYVIQIFTEKRLYSSRFIVVH